MNEAFSIVFFILSSLLSLIFAGGVIYLIVYLIRNKDKKISLDITTLLQIYLYLMSFTTLILGVVGYTILTNSALSFKFGIPFSYNLEKINEYYGKTSPYDEYYEGPECYMGEPIDIEDQRVCLEVDAQKKGLINGGTFAISMSILFILHQIGIYTSKKKDSFAWLKKIYNFVSLILFSLVGIVVIPVSIYQLFTFLFLRPEDITMIQPPGLALAACVFVVPLWVLFLINTNRLKDIDRFNKE